MNFGKIWTTSGPLQYELYGRSSRPWLSRLPALARTGRATASLAGRAARRPLFLSGIFSQGKDPCGRPGAAGASADAGAVSAGLHAPGGHVRADGGFGRRAPVRGLSRGGPGPARKTVSGSRRSAGACPLASPRGAHGKNRPGVSLEPRVKVGSSRSGPDLPLHPLGA